MRTASIRHISPGLAALLQDGSATGLTDRELLERFTTSRDQGGEFAFAALVARHGPMVRSVCHRMLHNSADADDAFQATFLVLVRRAGSIRLAGSLGPWLYAVTVRVARRARTVGARRQKFEAADASVETATEPRAAADHDLRFIIDDELSRLPESFRAAVVLCHMQGMTHEEAAERLRCPVGTVRSRLARGRALLRNRLQHGGWALAAGPAGWPELSEPHPTVPRELIHQTARIASRYAAGEPLGAIGSAGIAQLVTGVTFAMTISKLVAASSLLLFAGLTALGVSRLGAQTQAGKRPAASSARPSAESTSAGFAFQTPADNSRKTKSARGDATSRVDRALLADFPPVVVAVVPELGSVNVDPGLREIRVTFSKKMTDRSWSLTEGTKYSTPKVRGEIHYDKDQRTCVIPVQLEPGKTYVWGINSERFRNFQDVDGRPALPYLIVFRTRSGR